MAWMDNTGMYQKFGTEQTVTAIAGEFKEYGDVREVEIKLDLTKLTASDAVIIGADNFFFPKGMQIQEVELEVVTGATAAGAATLDLGLVQTDRTTTISATGLISALAKTSIDTAGKKVILFTGVTGVGASVGTQLSQVGYVTGKVNTGPFTAGLVMIRIRYFKP